MQKRKLSGNFNVIEPINNGKEFSIYEAEPVNDRRHNEKLDVLELQERTDQDDTRSFHVCDPIDFQNLKQLYDPSLKYELKEF